MTYKQSIEFLSSLIDYERWVYRNYEFKLDNYRRFLEKIGNPQERLKRVVLVAGTKGKGSTAIMLMEILKAHGERVGLYTSPHLLDYTERIKVNGRKIPRERFAEILNNLEPAILAHEPRITFFEALTTAAFLHFLDERTTMNVLEIGVGGRLDATNVTEPELSLITRIGYDHTKMLGNTLAKITGEKCGVLRPNRPALIAAQRPRVKSSMRKAIEEKGAKGIWWKDDFRVDLIEERAEGLKAKYKGIKFDTEFKLPVLGAHQAENAATAIAGAELLLDEVDGAKVRRVLAQIKLPSRIEKIQENPSVILDMSHNPESASTLRATLDKHFAHHPRRVLLIGVTMHKNKSRIISILAPFFTEVWVTQADLPRAEPKDRLLRLCRSSHPNCRSVESVPEGINQILDSLNKGDLLVISGSIYVAGEALRAFKARKGAGIKG
jgi:dihydrofolate synthase/folylpolyglutamate synthase